MGKLLLVLSVTFSCLTGNKVQAATLETVDRPKLVVGIVVDQMRWDYLYRYYDLYSEKGFKRLLNEGFSCENTMLDYVPTVTAIGHTCIYTGSVPSIHGITGNNFMIESTGETLYCTYDSLVSGVGSQTPDGRMSPRNLLVTTITDELRLATNFHSKTIGVALKDRASILPAGHTANAAYWFDDQAGKWISSTYYMQALPEWVNAFNRQDMAAELLRQDWNTLLPIENYTQSTKDDNPYEGPFEKGRQPLFPVKTSQLFKKKGYGLIRSTPYGNTLTLEMAKAAIENESMGEGDYTDFLAVSLSSTDYIGHQFGVNSVKTQDTYLRLDKDLAGFLDYLDSKVGKGNYTLFLTADHAAAHNIRFLEAHHIPSGAWLSGRIQNALDSLLNVRFRTSGLVRSLMNYQVHLNENKIQAAGLDRNKIKDAVIGYLQEQEGVAYVADMEKAAVAPVPLVIRERIVNGYNRQRSGTIQIIVKPGWYALSSKKEAVGTTHGVWYPYDSHIPLIFMGWGIRHGKMNREVYMTDIAPTIAALLKIQMPNGCVGKPVEEVIK